MADKTGGILDRPDVTLCLSVAAKPAVPAILAKPLPPTRPPTRRGVPDFGEAT